MTSIPVIVTKETFDPKKLSFGEPKTVKIGANGTMSKMPIKYDGKDLVLQTPVFNRCTIRQFEKKTNEDKNAVMMYQSIQYNDEEEYRQALIEKISDAVKQYIRTNVRTLFNRKKDTVSDLTFNSHVQEPADYCASIKTSVPTTSRDTMDLAEAIKAYRDTTEELTKQELADILSDNNGHVSARALISVPYAYTLNNKQYGFKTHLCTLDLKEKPMDGVEPIAEERHMSKESVSGELSNMPKLLGNAFIDVHLI